MHLEEYKQKADGKKLPNFKIASYWNVGIENISELSISELWEIHNKAINEIKTKLIDNIPSKNPECSLLDLKIEIADRLLDNCILCERKCKANRNNGQFGFCKAKKETGCFFEQILLGEEEPIIPSYEVFFAGCNMKCSYCYSHKAIEHPENYESQNINDFAKIVEKRASEGAKNINFIGGEPTVNLAYILKLLKNIDCSIPIIWNSNMYMSKESMYLLDGIVDLYLGDFKFGCDECAVNLSNTPNYRKTAIRNFNIASKSTDVIMRHLVVPNHIDCCFEKIAEYVRNNNPDIPFNLMFQYTPFWHAITNEKLSRQLTKEEISAAEIISEKYNLNTKKWKNTVNINNKSDIGKGFFETTITIFSNGKVVFQHLHNEKKNC